MKAPLAEATVQYAKKKTTPFHTPGHKQGNGAHFLLKTLVTEMGLKADVSLISALDNLHNPTGVIKEAQELAAQLYGAKAAFFSVNGTTGAIHAMLMATLSPGDKILVPRNVHRSVFGALVLTDLQPVWMRPSLFEGIAAGPTLDTVEKAVRENPDAKAILIVTPNYYGLCPDVKGIAELAHANNMLLLADEAHGAHLKFSVRLPEQSIDLGADISAMSTHKTLGAMTGASMLLVGSDRINVERVRRAMSTLTTTSPNQILLSSLDIARVQIAEMPNAIDDAADLAKELRRIVNEIRGLSSFGIEVVGKKGIADLDTTKITINTRALGISGLDLAAMLHERGVECELADPYHVLLIVTYADVMKQAHTAILALMDIANKYSGDKLFTLVAPPAPTPQTEMSPREAFFVGSKSVSFARCVGRVAAEEITPYPPGIPCILPGEVITKEMSEYLTEVKNAGYQITGAADPTLRRINVVEKELPK